SLEMRDPHNRNHQAHEVGCTVFRRIYFKRPQIRERGQESQQGRILVAFDIDREAELVDSQGVN
ncbi:hypothetical protein E4U11_006990, partial [Claviceps purpurea]